MMITLNPNKELVAKIKDGLKQKGGYCPCRLERTPENKCMCKEFREQIKDPNFTGYCHCMLYYKDNK
ncbi:MAG: ferredoxin thioredoxin reductase catalytic beta chain [Ruminococcus sp.]|nr:ferredoxin thioredoxin reductase catalytic beta chain [Ruminococcus sp.]MDD6446811.1 ferredoxin thioredoxin reductase catalytic beta chain [Ruminococcus sp.]